MASDFLIGLELVGRTEVVHATISIYIQLSQMTRLSVWLIVAMFSSVGLANADVPPRARLVAVSQCDEKPADAPANVLPFGYGFKPGFTLHYLVEGESLLGIKEESLKLDKIVAADGRDLLATAGPQVAKLGPCWKKNPGQRFSSFSIEVSANEFQRVDQIRVSGSVTALSASKPAMVEGTLSPEESSASTIGPFQLKIAPPVPSVGDTKDFRLGIVFVGPMDKVIELKAFNGDKTMPPSGAGLRVGGGPDTTFYYRERPPGPIRVTIKYWDDMKEQVVRFEK